MCMLPAVSGCMKNKKKHGVDAVLGILYFGRGTFLQEFVKL